MNAHTPKRLVAAQTGVAHGCPAEHLGRQIAAAQARIEEIDRDRVAGAACGHHEREAVQLHDLVASLDNQLEWVKPQSVAGVFVLLAQLAVLAEQIHAGEPDAYRRFVRVHHLAVRGLSEVGGLDALCECLSSKLIAPVELEIAGGGPR